jgi:hypothetical protein
MSLGWLSSHEEGEHLTSQWRRTGDSAGFFLFVRPPPVTRRSLPAFGLNKKNRAVQIGVEIAQTESA